MRRDIIVVGQAKTGTTGIYNLIKAALAPVAVEYYFLFEPVSAEQVTTVKAARPDLGVLTKVMYEQADAFGLERFGRRVLTTRYEDFVAGRVEALGDYLGLPLDPAAATPPSWLRHIARSRRAGAWRHWFTDDDVERYRPLLATTMTTMGYDDDWELADDPVIDPDSSSAYVADRLPARRSEIAAAKGEVDEADTDDIGALVSMADDGSGPSSLALAHLLLDGDRFGGPWPVSARYWARRAELQGSIRARRVRRRIDAMLDPAQYAAAIAGEGDGVQAWALRRAVWATAAKRVVGKLGQRARSLPRSARPWRRH